MHSSQSISDVNFVGLAAWKFVPEEPRHNTFHKSLADQAIKSGANINYLGLEKTHFNPWINHVLPDSVLKKYPYISPRYLKHIKRSLSLDSNKATVIYMFEGTLLWIPILIAISRAIPNSAIVCNLFPSSGYNRSLFKGIFIRKRFQRLLQRLSSRNNLYLTFDTDLMRDKVNRAVGEKVIHSKFPLPSALGFRPLRRNSLEQHFRVLVNMRGFDRQNLQLLLDGSCKECVFVFPRGPLASTPLWNDLGRFNNLEFDRASIPLENYEEYVDQFDYMIFLYEPAIDSSGKLLDALVRNIGVCLPRQSAEWHSIAEKNGRVYSYDWAEPHSMRAAFSHPTFVGNFLDQEPSFTPENALMQLRKYAPEKNNVGPQYSDNSRLKSSALTFLQWQISFIASGIYSLAVRLKLFK